MTAEREPVSPAPETDDSPTEGSTPTRGRIGRWWWAIGIAIGGNDYFPSHDIH